MAPEAAEAFWMADAPCCGGGSAENRAGEQQHQEKEPLYWRYEKASAQAEALGKGTGEDGRVAEGPGEAGSGSHPAGGSLTARIGPGADFQGHDYDAGCAGLGQDRHAFFQTSRPGGCLFSGDLSQQQGLFAGLSGQKAHGIQAGHAAAFVGQLHQIGESFLVLDPGPLAFEQLGPSRPWDHWSFCRPAGPFCNWY